MKVLLTHRYFWPDSPPYAAMLRYIGERLSDAGHDVHVFSTKPSYRESGYAPSSEDLRGLNVRRIRVFRENRSNFILRLLNVLLYCVGVFVHIIRIRPDVVTASTFPPVFAAWAASLAAKLVGAKFIYHMQDIHPEVSQYSGGIMGRGLFYRALAWVDNQTLRRAEVVIVLSRDMSMTLRERGLGNLPIRIINNFLLDDFGESDNARVSQELCKKPGVRRIIFAGNLGRFQNLPLLVEGVASCLERYSDLELFLLGDGEALPELCSRWGGHPQIQFAPFLPFSHARALIEDSDIALVSLARDIYKVSYPSKILTYLELGIPILALVEKESEMAHEIMDNHLGLVPESQTPQGVENALIQLLENPEYHSGLHAWGETGPTRNNVVSDWVMLMDKLSRNLKSDVH